ncbi:MAG: ABC transporter permease [Rikenellaceae bacterium]|nr:ABC transporter permease [Rikenellaceae bacterium]
MSFSFVEGRPFDKEEYESGVQVAVVSESMAEKIFSGENPIGKIIEITFIPFRIIGIVRDVSPIFTEAAGDIWVPVTSSSDFQRKGGIIMLQAYNKKDFPAIISEIREVERKHDIVNESSKIYLQGPFSRNNYVIDISSKNIDEETDIIRSERQKTIILFCLLLLVPAVNLASFSVSRIKKRMMEIGVRKAFGAKRHVILFQILYENMLTSLIGGVIGLLLSYLIIFSLRHWLLGIPADGTIPVSALFSWPVIISVFLFSIVLNILSAGIPAYKASKLEIVNSITQNDN